jgi:hypothetical protein
VIANLNKLLVDTGLADCPGKVFYSGTNSIQTGDLYLLGFNPGGDPDQETVTVRQHLNETPPDFNEFVDGHWGAPNCLLDRGSAVLQKRVQWMLRNLGYEVREVCASNLIFARSTGIVTLPASEDQLADACWPVHEFVLRIVKPKTIIALGTQAFKAIRKRTTKNSIVNCINSGHGNWKIYATEIDFNGCKISLVAPPHLSRYKIDNHADEFSWMQNKIG